MDYDTDKLALPAYPFYPMKLSSILFAFFMCNLAYSQEKSFKNEFGFRSDNDSYLAYGQDQYYTNGLILSYRHALNQEGIHRRLAKKTCEIEAGQLMYNPSTGKINNIREVDRPFAAYLYAGGKFNWFFKNEQLIEFAVNLGTIGPKALGKEVQEGLHEAVGFYRISGWEYQVNNETGINTSLRYSTLIERKQPDNDFTLNTYANIGTTFSGAGAGILFRAGRINKLFNSVSTNSRIVNSRTDSLPAKEIFFFTRPMLHYVAYDATIQGGMFLRDKGPVTFDPKKFQYSQEFGINYAVDRWTLNFSIIFKSRDVKTQDTPHQYGSAMIYYRF